MERKDLPLNIDADEHRRLYREALFDYLRDRTSREERKALVKEALKELWEEGKAEFGWFSIKLVGWAGFLGIIYFLLIYNGWHR